MIRRPATAVAFLIAVVVGLILMADSAHANPIPGAPDGPIEVAADSVDGDCTPQEAPPVQGPQQGMPGFFMDPPTDPAPDAATLDLGALWRTSGVGGFHAATYDLFCASDLVGYATGVPALTQTGTANGITDYALTLTALTDSIERRAWDPSWVLDVLGGFAERATDLVSARILGPLLVIGGLLTILMVLLANQQGNVTAAAVSTAWAIGVVALAAVILTSPIRPAVLAQSGAAALTTALNDTPDPATANTERVMRTVHYPMWVRKTLGSTDPQVAATYGPRLFEATRWSYTELDATRGNPDARDRIAAAKATLWAANAAELQAQAPEVYRSVQGREPRIGLAVTELAYALAANAFRLFAVFLMMLCVVQLAALSVVWLVTAVWTMTPQGEALGRALLSAGARALAYALAATLGAWGWGLWSEFALAPGLSGWWSLALLTLGLVIFWTLLRPDRKILALASGGRITGAGASGRWLLNKLASYAVTRKAGGDALEDHVDGAVRVRTSSEEHAAPAPPPMPALYPGGARPHPGRVVHEGILHDPPTSPPPVRVYAPPVVVYQRAADEGPPPVPPPGGSTTSADVEVFGRSAP